MVKYIFKSGFAINNLFINQIQHYEEKFFKMKKSFKKLSNSDFDKNGVDSNGTHWLQYAAFAFSAFAIFTTWAFFFDYKFHNFVANIFRIINCSGFNCNGVY